MPKTIEELQAALRLGSKSDAEALIKADPVTEAARMYLNRCLSSGSTRKQLPDWKHVDIYLQNKRMKVPVRGTLEQEVAKDCTDKPYELLPHAGMFALRMMDFLISEKGEMYDIPLETDKIRYPRDVQFDRCIRIMDLLGFLVNQNREMKREREEKKMKEDGWI